MDKDRAYVGKRLTSLHHRIDWLVTHTTYLRDTVDNGDKPLYRSIGRRLEKALEQVEKALERLENE